MIKKNINSSIIFHVIRLSERVKQHGELLTSQHGITTQQWVIMLLLAKDPNILYIQENPDKEYLVAKDIADALFVSRANVTNLLNILTQKELITPITLNGDNRRKPLELTEKGKKVIADLELPRYKRNAALFKKYNNQEKENFINFIESSLQIMKADFEKLENN
jgi:DNA-binding MarR family transcriptional regulator